MPLKNITHVKLTPLEVFSGGRLGRSRCLGGPVHPKVRPATPYAKHLPQESAPRSLRRPLRGLQGRGLATR